MQTVQSTDVAFVIHPVAVLALVVGLVVIIVAVALLFTMRKKS